MGWLLKKKNHLSATVVFVRAWQLPVTHAHRYTIKKHPRNRNEKVRNQSTGMLRESLLLEFLQFSSTKRTGSGKSRPGVSTKECLDSPMLKIQRDRTAACVLEPRRSHKYRTLLCVRARVCVKGRAFTPSGPASSSATRASLGEGAAAGGSRP